jgi:LDH2 family malate/lactate/ureidoglycolate dehydrogenase
MTPNRTDSVKVGRTLAAAWGVQLLTALGADIPAATQTIDHLLAAEDAGHPSHGLRMLVSIAAAVEQGHLDPGATPVVETTSGSAARIDGRRGLGPPIGLLATEEAIRLARIHGTSAVSVRAAGHMGRLAPYADAAAAGGCALFMCANDGGANQHVVPTGGEEGRLSTNPIAFGFPRPEPPHLIVDMATSAYAHGTLGALSEAGRPLPDDAFVPGADDLMLPMAGYKGFALGLVVEALAGALTGAGVVRDDPPPTSQGALLVAVDVAALASPEAATRDLEAAIVWVRSAASADAEPIRIPGENRVAGAGEEVAIAARLWRMLVELSNNLAVPLPPSRKDPA